MNGFIISHDATKCSKQKRAPTAVAQQPMQTICVRSQIRHKIGVDPLTSVTVTDAWARSHISMMMHGEIHGKGIAPRKI